MMPRPHRGVPMITTKVEAARRLLRDGAWLYKADDTTKRIIGGRSWSEAPHAAKAIVEHLKESGVVALIPASLGLVVVDLDTDQARTWYSDWKTELRKDAVPLIEQKSRRDNGLHLYYRCPPVGNGRSIKTVTGTDIKKGVDIRGSKGYVILWGDTIIDLANSIDQDEQSLEGWVPIEFFDMMVRDPTAPQEWQMEGSRNDDLNRDTYIASLRGDEQAARNATRRALIQGLPPDEIAATADHAAGDGLDQQDQETQLRTAAHHRAARLALLYDRRTPQIKNYRADGKSADYHGLVYVEWTNDNGWTELAGAEVIEGLRVCNNHADPGIAKKALMDLASIKHYGNITEWNCYGKSSQIDKDVMIGLPGGKAIDTSDGSIVDQKPEWRVTRHIRVPLSKSKSPKPRMWIDCVDRWAGGKPGLAEFLQQLCGYALYGGNPEHKFVFLYGDGANGKSTFLDLLSYVFGPDYTVSMGAAVYEDKASDHSVAFKNLEHKRLLISSEIKPTVPWNVANIKSITGGGEIYARSLYKNPEPMKVTGLPVFQGNHLPMFFDASTGWARRALIVPFDVEIPEADRILDLEKHLRKEAPEILDWVLDGLHSFLDAGRLEIPECVSELTDEYLMDYAESDDSINLRMPSIIEEYIDNLKEDDFGETGFWVTELLDELGVNSQDVRSKIGVFKIIKRLMKQRGFTSAIRRKDGIRLRGYWKIS